MRFEGALESDAPVNFPDPPHSFLNCLRPYRSAWSQVTSDRWVLEIVSVGYTLQFLATTTPNSIPSLGMLLM